MAKVNAMTTENEKAVFTYGMSDGEPIIRGVVWPPKECSCGRMVAFIVNRGGKTRCLTCDRESQRDSVGG